MPALAASVQETAGECATPGTPDGEFFPNVSKIVYEGPNSMNPLAFHYYNAEEVIMGKPMKEWCARPSTPSPTDVPAMPSRKAVVRFLWLLRAQSFTSPGAADADVRS